MSDEKVVQLFPKAATPDELFEIIKGLFDDVVIIGTSSAGITVVQTSNLTELETVGLMETGKTLIVDGILE